MILHLVKKNKFGKKMSGAKKNNYTDPSLLFVQYFIEHSVYVFL